MRPKAAPNPAPLPDPATLARLAEDTKLPAAAALKKWQESQAALAEVEKAERDREEGQPRRLAIPQLALWPAALDDFYRRVIRARDKADSQPRFRKFLRYQIETEQQKIRADLDQVKGHLAEQQQQIDLMAKQGRRLARDSYPGTLTLEQAAKFDENYIAQQTRRLLSPEDMDGELERRFERCQAAGFDQHTWNRVVSEYLDWWAEKRHADQVEAGRARARAHKRKKKVSEHEATLNTVNAIVQPEMGVSAAKAKKSAAALRNKQSAS